MTDKKQTQAAIDKECEALCDELEERSELQATIFRAFYRDKLNANQVARMTRMSIERVMQERAHGWRTIADILSGGMLEQWSTPKARNVPEAGKAAKSKGDSNESAGADAAA